MIVRKRKDVIKMFQNNMENENENPLEKYGRDITQTVIDGKVDPVIGRDDEIRSITRILSRKTKNNKKFIGVLNDPCNLA